jgi:ABC-type branched-subunit amino acid transport system substrate-binding protein
MPRRLLARGWALAGCAALATVTGAASCSSTAATVSVKGKALTIYMSAPASFATDPQSEDVVDAERLAYQQQHGEVSGYRLTLHTLPSGKLSDNARTAIEDSDAIAYLGELQPGASANSLGITNAEDLLQVAPTDTALELTQSTPAVPGSPDVYYESLSTYGRTFARVVPTTAVEARALVGEMRALGVRDLFVTGDGSPYGKALEFAISSDASSSSITVVHSQSGADAVLYAGTSAAGAATAFNQAAGANPALKLFAPSALAERPFASALSPAAQRRTVVSSPGFTASDLNPQGQQFVSAFRTAYGHSPAPSAIFGYEAMSAVLAVLHEAGSSAGNRATVVHDFFTLRNRSSVLGTYSINHNGDTNIGPFVFSHVRGGALIPFKAVQEQG